MLWLQCDIVERKELLRLRHQRAKKTQFFRWNLYVIGIFGALVGALWPNQLSAERAFAATNPSFTVKPNNHSVNGDLVQAIRKPKSNPVAFTYQGTQYRALHTIQERSPISGRWSTVSSRLSQDENEMSDGFEFDAITAVSPGTMWYAGTRIGHVVTGQPNGTWSATSATLPERTVTAICQLSGDGGQVAAVGYGGYRSATPATPGHVFVTFDGGKRWSDITNNLPDSPVQKLVFASSTGTTQLEADVADHWYVASIDGHWHQFDRHPV